MFVRACHETTLEDWIIPFSAGFTSLKCGVLLHFKYSSQGTGRTLTLVVVEHGRTPFVQTCLKQQVTADSDFTREFNIKSRCDNLQFYHYLLDFIWLNFLNPQNPSRKTEVL